MLHRNDRPIGGDEDQATQGVSVTDSVMKMDPEKSALAYHSIFQQHRFAFEEVSILARENHYWKRAFMEELFIKSSDSCVNFKGQETLSVNPIYSLVLNVIERTQR